MSPLGFLRAVRMLGFLIIVAAAGIFFCMQAVVQQLRTEAHYRNHFGAGWQLEYEKDLGPLAAAHTRMFVAAVGAVTLCALVVWVYRLIRYPARTRHSRKSHSERFRSPLERLARWRRNAVLGVYFGLVGIVGGLVLVVFHIGIFADHSNEMALGVAVFLGGYAGVMAGCGWWLKTKQWSEAIVFIAVMPLAIFCIPFVRLVVLAVPLLLPSAMVMMPFILIVVVAVLPNRSRQSHRSGWGKSAHRRRRSLGSGWATVPDKGASSRSDPAGLAVKDQ